MQQRTPQSVPIVTDGQDDARQSIPASPTRSIPAIAPSPCLLTNEELRALLDSLVNRTPRFHAHTCRVCGASPLRLQRGFLRNVDKSLHHCPDSARRRWESKRRKTPRRRAPSSFTSCHDIDAVVIQQGLTAIYAAFLECKAANHPLRVSRLHSLRSLTKKRRDAIIAQGVSRGFLYVSSPRTTDKDSGDRTVRSCSWAKLFRTLGLAENLKPHSRYTAPSAWLDDPKSFRARLINAYAVHRLASGPSMEELARVFGLGVRTIQNDFKRAGIMRIARFKEKVWNESKDHRRHHNFAQLRNRFLSDAVEARHSRSWIKRVQCSRAALATTRGGLASPTGHGEEDAPNGTPQSIAQSVAGITADTAHETRSGAKRRAIPRVLVSRSSVPS